MSTIHYFNGKTSIHKYEYVVVVVPIILPLNTRLFLLRPSSMGRAHPHLTAPVPSSRHRSSFSEARKEKEQQLEFRAEWIVHTLVGGD